MPKPRIPAPIHRWTALKLEYLDHYLQGYVTATKRAEAIYYLDAFAGCGDCIIQETGFSIDGSPWRALNTVPKFTHYYFVEKNPVLAKHLEKRINEASITNASVFNGDCNEVIHSSVLTRLPRRAPSFAFLDPTGLQLHWSTIQLLAAHRLGSLKMELLILYPYDMAIDARLFNQSIYPALTRFFGDEAWLKELNDSHNRNENRDQRRVRFVGFYRRRLEELGYRYVEVYGPLYDQRRPLYNVIFASDHDVGAKIMRDVWSKPRAIRGQLGYTPVKRPALDVYSTTN